MTSKLMGVTTEADTGTRRGGGRTIAAGFLAALMMLMALSLWTIVPKWLQGCGYQAEALASMSI